MAARCKGFNSKCFLFTYLIIVGLVIFLWMNRFTMDEDDREIPVGMLSYLESPPRPIPSVALNISGKLALTSEFLVDKWTFVYFTHLNCLPNCQLSLDTMRKLKLSFVNIDFQFLAIDIDVDDVLEPINNLEQALHFQDYDFMVAATPRNEIKNLANSFEILYLRTDYKGGSYQIDQQHKIFLVDPKGRVYATFRSPYKDVISQVHAARYFYARTE